MGIKQDAAALVLFFYRNKVTGETEPNQQTLFEATGWVPHRMDNALEYCEENGFLTSRKVMGTVGGIPHRVIMRLTSTGVDIVENTLTEDGKREFNVIFNVAINNEFNIDSIIKGEAKLF
jgi:hypothetical protein